MDSLNCTHAAPSAKVHNKSTAPVARMQVAHEKPCWEVAGISKSAIAERSRILWLLEIGARAEDTPPVCTSDL